MDGRQAELVERNLETARRVAATMYPRVRGHVAFDELVALANAGLAEAAARYDPARGAQFHTFAWYRIHGAILDELRRSAQLPRRTWARLAASGRAPGPPDAQIMAPSPGAPGAPAGDAGFLLSLDLLRDRGFDAAGEAPGPADGLDLARNAARLREAIALLPDKQRELVRMHYWEGKNLVQAGAELGLSKSWASRLHAQAVDRLRKLLDDAG